MNKKVIIVYFLLILTTPFIISLGIKYLPENPQPEIKSYAKIYGENKFSQIIKPENNNLSAVGITFKNPNLRNKNNLHLEIKNDSGLTLVNKIVNGQVIGDGNFLRIKFPPIIDSINKNLIVNFSSENSIDNDALEISLTNNHNGMKPQLALATFYSPENPIFTGLDIYSDWFNKLFKDFNFMLTYFFLLFIIIILINLEKLKYKIAN